MSEGAARPRAFTTPGMDKAFEKICTPAELARHKDRSDVEAYEKATKPESWFSILRGKLVVWWGAALRFQRTTKVMGVLGFFGAVWKWVPALVPGSAAADGNWVR